MKRDINAVHKASKDHFVRARECRYCRRHMTKEFTEELWHRNQTARSDAAKRTLAALRRSNNLKAKKRAIEVNKPEIVRMWKLGKSLVEISVKLNVSQSTIFRTVKEYKEKKAFQSKLDAGTFILPMGAL